MVRYCSNCNRYCEPSAFSSNQRRKGADSRCKDCVGGRHYGGSASPSFSCGTCGGNFNSQNELNMHMQVHRPRDVACPVCRETRFRSGANAVQHVESGYCTGCVGQDNARRAIYDYASQQGQMRPYISHIPMLTNGSYGGGNVPDYPYSCPQCVNKSFRQLSQLLQHNDQKHNNVNRIGY